MTAYRHPNFDPPRGSTNWTMWASSLVSCTTPEVSRSDCCGRLGRDPPPAPGGGDGHQGDRLHLGLARNTVREALRSEVPPHYERKRKGSIVDAVEPDILGLLKEFPTMPATVVAERIGWRRSIRVLRDRVAELRPLFVPPDPCQRTSYRPGELAQFDLWQPDVLIPLGFGQADKLWVIVGCRGFSRFLGAWMIPSRKSHDVLGGHLEVLRQFPAVPRYVVWDHQGAIGQWHGPKMVFTEAFQAFRGTLGIGARLCLRHDPETKALPLLGIAISFHAIPPRFWGFPSTMLAARSSARVRMSTPFRASASSVPDSPFVSSSTGLPCSRTFSRLSPRRENTEVLPTPQLPRRQATVHR